MVRNLLLFLLGLFLCSSAHGQNVAYVSGTGGEPWGMPGNLNTLDDVFGIGNWDRLDFPTAVGGGLFGYSTIFIDGGNGSDTEFVSFVENNRASLENWVSGGGRLLINAARWGAAPNLLDLGFGITLDSNGAAATGVAANGAHAIYNGPWGATGVNFDGDFLSHDRVFGAGLIPLMYGDNDPGRVILGEKAYGSGWVVAGGLTLPFFGEHIFWSANSGDFHRNLFYYVHNVQAIPEPASFFILLMGAGAMAIARRRCG
ncbi:MAG TPA: PEP-CTERM sorting domain-containing protein [Pirellulaceae bacterium]|nr:PEP-CTERM sorting domain-containing protein [Pirellulaceae bacterium]